MGDSRAVSACELALAVTRRDFVPVVAEEELLERGRRARQRADVVLDEALEDAVQVARVEAEVRTRTFDARVVDARQLAQRVEDTV